MSASAPPKPDYTANVSPELALLRRAGAGRMRHVASVETGAPRGDAERQAPARAPASDVQEGTNPDPRHDFPGVLLRQDGARPVRLRALALMDVSSHFEMAGASGGTALRHLRLYTGADGKITAQVHLDPGETFPSRPVWRVRQVSSIADVNDLLKEAAEALQSQTPSERKHQTLKLSNHVRTATPPLFARA